MDYYNFRDTITEPLEYLHRSVRRGGFRSIKPKCELCPDCNRRGPESNFQKRYSGANSRYSIPVLEKGTSSTKPAEREVHGRYSVLSYSNFQQSPQHYNYTESAPSVKPPPSRHHAHKQPIIRVSIIPNSYSNKTRKRRHLLKKVQSSVSNQENTIKNKNVVAKDLKKEKQKIFEIRTAGSVETLNNQTRYNKDCNDIEHLKGLIKSLNMDKKKKKGKKKPEIVLEDEHDVDIYSITSYLNDSIDTTRKRKENNMVDCKCLQSGKQRISNEATTANMRMSSDLQDLRSRVKIVGRIGLDQDDKYILDCNATVDDKPIETNIQGNFNGQQMGRNVQPDSPSSFEQRNLKPDQFGHQSGKRGHRDFYVQADIGNSIGPISVEFCSVATQCAPPSNFNSICFSNIEKLHIMSNPKQTLHRNYNTEQNQNFSDYDSSSPQSCSSPLVIISVYPKQGTPENDSYDEVNQERPAKDVNSKPQAPKPKQGKKGKQKTDSDSKSPRSPRSPGSGSPKGSRSPSRNSRSSSGKSSPKPKKEAQESKGKKLEGKGQKSPKGSSPITPRSSASINKNQIQKDKSNQDTGSKGPKQSPTPSTSKAKGQQNSQPIKTQKQYTTRNVSKDASEDPAVTKKAIVDAYTKKVTAQIMNRNDDSNVAINIDGETEFYDVLFHQGNRTTDLRIRKTMKNQASQKSYADDDAPDPGSASLENFFFMMDDRKDRKRSISQTLLFGDPDRGAYDMEASSSRFVARDSIEISHRRDQMSNGSKVNLDLHNSTHVNHSYDSIDNSADSTFNAPIKHFKGDNCPLPNPVERDKEIRLLLGVDNRKSPSRHDRDQRPYIKDDSLRCFFKPSPTKLVSSNSQQDGILNLYRVDCKCYEDTSSLQTPSSETIISECCGQCFVCPNDTSPSDTPHDQLKPEFMSADGQTPQKEKQCDKQNVQVGQQGMQPRNEPQPKREHLQNLNQSQEPGFQEFILNRNINIYLQIEKFTKQKPILLTRAQYDKVKRVIEIATSKKQKAICRPSAHQEFKKKAVARKPPNECDRVTPQGLPKSQENVSPGNDASQGYCCIKQCRKCHTCYDVSTKNIHKYDETMRKNSCQKCGNSDCITYCPICGRYDLLMCQTCDQPSCDVKVHNVYQCPLQVTFEENTKVKNDKQSVKDSTKVKTEKQSVKNSTKVKTEKHIFSSNIINSPEVPLSEIHCTNVSYARHVIFSATKVGETMGPGKALISEKYTESLHTIFKGRRRSPTPNLGTSALSLFSDYSDAHSYKQPEEEKPRKPFLRRLMSCLVMHSRTSQAKVTDKQKNKSRPILNSIDSYHISTSLGAIDLSSSIYDTSASFYSNHSVYPVNSRNTMKRGFLSSVRGFLYRT